MSGLTLGMGPDWQIKINKEVRGKMAKNSSTDDAVDTTSIAADQPQVIKNRIADYTPDSNSIPAAQCDVLDQNTFVRFTVRTSDMMTPAHVAANLKVIEDKLNIKLAANQPAK